MLSALPNVRNLHTQFAKHSILQTNVSKSYPFTEILHVSLFELLPTNETAIYFLHRAVNKYERIYDDNADICINNMNNSNMN